jgi:hypothetical protein
MLFHTQEESAARLRVEMSAESGPLGTSDYQISAVFSPAEEESTSIRFEYEYSLGFRAQVALGTYLNTVARSKVGFTVVGEAADGEVEYIDGMRGMIERNAMRYYLAIVAFFENLDAHDFDARAAAAQWFDLTARFPRQLHEVEREDYLAAKAREYEHQRRLQKNLSKLQAISSSS